MKKRVFSALLLAAGLSLVLFGALTALLLEVTGKQLLLMGVVLVFSATVSTLFVRKIGLRLLGELKAPLETAEKALDHIAAGRSVRSGLEQNRGRISVAFSGDRAVGGADSQPDLRAG